MKFLLHLYALAHALMAALFAAASLLLIGQAAGAAWAVVGMPLGTRAAQHVIEAMGLLAAAVVALQVSQTVVEEEVVRAAHMSAPTRARRFLSRFFVVVLVALAIETLVATFKAVHESLDHLLYASLLVLATGALLASWGVFVHLNRSAEELEPEAMKRAKEEDAKLP
ncbi:hypothetical protein ABXN37_13470 [Piscinibacter sakaiensis]|uniref:N-linked glycosylation glycosyltransferase PglG n=1 Tax=Piscinibacter sakaiensis TaxID=1547922 RepID=A0A0K8P0L2_PISS1|nr:hypothetical protein [Piscinibacter sakaiensis]GAP36161.1 N-linked glycosylation glycosyltransferase PglG [Piscinibacter sakaiensis]